MRLERLPRRSARRTVAAYIAGYGWALGLATALLATKGFNPLRAYASMLAYVVGDGLHSFLVTLATLMIIGVAAAVAFRVAVWNIGLEGQYVLGGIGAAWAALYSGVVGAANVALQLIMGFLLGALWALPPALLLVLLGVNEILTTVMLNYVAVYILDYLLYGPWAGTYGFPKTPNFPYTLPHLPIPPGLVAAVAVLVLYWLGLRYTTAGLVARATGLNERAARTAGYRVRLAKLTAFLLSGGLAGLAGAWEADYRLGCLLPEFPSGYGFLGIVVATMAFLEPALIPVAAAVVSFFVTGAYAVAIPYLGLAAGGLLMAGHVSGYALSRYRIVLTRG